MIYAILQSFAPDFATLTDIFETDEIPVVSDQQEEQVFDGMPIVSYTINFNALNIRQRLNLAEHAAHRFHLSLIEAHGKLLRHGYPLNAAHVRLASTKEEA